MRFLLDDEQREFIRSLDALLTAADTPAVVRGWAAGEHAPGLDLWRRLADAGVFALAVPEAYGGVGPLPVETAVACGELGRHGVPGPVGESVAAGVLLGAVGGPVAKEWLPRIASGTAVVSLVLEGYGPYALDADVADAVFTVTGDELRLTWGHGEPTRSMDPARRLFRPRAGGEVVAAGPRVREASRAAGTWATFATAAQALGCGEALLRATVAYVKQRTQFGVPVGSFQAVKHRLADTLLGLEFARPLLYGAAVELAEGAPGAGAAVAAAKVAAGEAGYAAARTALHLHGAVGYTEELDLAWWLRRARPLRDAWGTPSACRARVLEG
ncbi:acyl-CoA dehydrogenase family protein [Streptomyces cyaneofuscatus]|uniref:Acyl-CoA/acyl-ACP dehydrogenase n=1 Tax=Streptomyces cyaneofuscatus TaxID=66883 RepID=A0ABZ1ESK7_9ACTN|nr:acyl-CoA dehydrogenase family protein [Streptomyces cyaneofuscatus]WSB07103.1 acyl-CoA/acyl-ACP dehydrogenase [Streptomyces cyaneofuscatus]WSD49362.1 acyl-CoA/acyl-ACP dehydrogenase [Streptomyces cyaneofuscatus]WTA92780.1 acyl-CoA/acyl-ACP dehydrogenase [Streptomyces cyaneofuscatus]